MATEMDINSDMDIDMELVNFFKVFKRRISPYPNSAIGITYGISRRKFQRRYRLVALLIGENYNMQIFGSSYRHWDCSPN